MTLQNIFEVNYLAGKPKMSIEDRMNATAKNIEGKMQEAAAEITGDPKDKAEGKEKQAEAETQHSIENAKDEIKKAID